MQCASTGVCLRLTRSDAACDRPRRDIPVGAYIKPSGCAFIEQAQVLYSLPVAIDPSKMVYRRIVVADNAGATLQFPQRMRMIWPHRAEKLCDLLVADLVQRGWRPLWRIVFLDHARPYAFQHLASFE